MSKCCRRPNCLYFERLESRELLAATPGVEMILGGSAGDQAYGIATDAANNLYLTGLFGDTLDFDPGPAVSSLTSNGGSDIYVVKADASRAVLWARGFGGPGRDVAERMILDRDGNTFIMGTYTGTVQFDSIPLTSTSSSTFLARLDAGGAVVWAKTIAASATELYNVHMALDDRAANPQDRGLFLAQGAFISRLSTDTGSIQWTKKVTTRGSLGFTGVTLDPSGTGSLVLTGDFREQVTLGGVTLKLSRGDSGDTLVARANLSGNIVWAKAIGTGTLLSTGGNVAVAGSDIYVTGRFHGTAKFDGITLKNPLSNTADNRYIAKLGASGNVRWAQAASAIQPDSWIGWWAPYDAIAVSPSGSVFLTGSFGVAWKFGGQTLTPLAMSGIAPPPYSLDGFVAELSANTGQFVEAWRFGGENSDQALALAIDAIGNPLVAAYVNRSTGGSADFPNGATHASASTDLAVLRFSVPPAAPAALINSVTPLASRFPQSEGAPSLRLLPASHERQLLAAHRRRGVPTAGSTTALHAESVDQAIRLYARRSNKDVGDIALVVFEAGRPPER